MEEMVFLIEYKDGELWYANLNNVAKDLFGEGFIGKKFKEVLPEPSYKKFGEYYLKSIRYKERVVFTDINPFLLDKPSSETIITPIIQEDGSCSEAIGITKNIESLREQQEDYLFMKSFLESTSDAILIIGTDNIVVKANRAFTEMFEWSDEEVIGENWFRIGFIPDDEIENVKAIKERMEVLENTPVMETIRLTKSQKEVPVSVSYSPLTNEQGELVAYSMIYRDMTNIISLESQLEWSNEQYKSLFEKNSLGIFMLNTEGIIEKVNPACEKISGYTEAETLGFNFQQVLSQAKDRDIINDRIVTDFQLKIEHKKGHTVHLECKTVPIIVEKQFRGTYVIAEDVTVKKQISEALMQSEMQYRLITENSQDLIKVVSANKKVTYASPSFTHVLGIPHESMIGESMLFGVWDEDYDVLSECHQKLVETNEPTSMEFRYKNHLGEPVWVEVKVTPILEEDKIVSFISTGRVITERKQFEDKLWQHANHDSLTGLPNRRMLENVFHESLERCCDEDMMAILFLDCDKFKHINDTFGHDVGDELLIALGKRLKAEIRENDIAARLGGDEFVVLLRNIQDKAHVERVAERLMEILREPYVLSHHTLHVTSSIGISMYPQHGNSAKDLLLLADEALYEVKKEGRNGFRIAE